MFKPMRTAYRPVHLKVLQRVNSLLYYHLKQAYLTTKKEVLLELPPHHLIDDACITLDNLHHFSGDVFVDVVGDGDAVVAGGVHGDGGIDGLKERLFVDAGDEEAGFVKGFRPLCRGADADGREGVAYRSEERTLFGQGA